MPLTATRSSPLDIPKHQRCLLIAMCTPKTPRPFGEVAVPSLTSRLHLVAGRYPYIGAPLALSLAAREPWGWEPFCELTCNYDRGMSVGIEGDEVLVKTYSENAEVAAAVVAAGYFQPTDKRQPLNFGDLEVWKVTDKLLTEFCSANRQWAKSPLCNQH